MTYSTQFLSKLSHNLSLKLSKREVKTIFFDLGIEIEEFPDEGKSNKIQELIKELNRNDRLEELLMWVQQNRSNIDISEFEEVTISSVEALTFGKTPNHRLGVSSLFFASIIFLLVAITLIFRRGFFDENVNGQLPTPVENPSEITASSTSQPTNIPLPMAEDVITSVAISTKSPTLFDDFNGNRLDSSYWDFDDLDLSPVAIVNGAIEFNLHQLDPQKSQSITINSKLSGSSRIERIIFNVALDTPSGTKPGKIGIQSQCNHEEEGTFLLVRLSKTDSVLRIDYNEAAGSDNVQLLGPDIKRDQVYEIDLRWDGSGLDIYLDGILVHDAIPCDFAQFVNLAAMADGDETIIGRITEISIWKE